MQQSSCKPIRVGVDCSCHRGKQGPVISAGGRAQGILAEEHAPAGGAIGLAGDLLLAGFDSLQKALKAGGFGALVGGRMRH